MARAFISAVDANEGGNHDMKAEQFQNLSLKEAREILDMASDLMSLAEELFCMVRGVIKKASADPANTWIN
jgi:hypothetical protein